MRSTIIRDVTLVLPDRLLPGGAVRFDDGTLTYVGPAERVAAASATVVDGVAGHYLAPGLIDLQLNGAFGHDFTANPESLWTVAQRLPRLGVTAYLPTIITAPPSAVPAAQAALAHGNPPDAPHARPLGLHLEGPYLSPAKRGAHPPEHLRLPDAHLAADWSPATNVLLVTLAPELPAALPLIERLTAQGVVVAAGHSAATLAQAQAGLEAGITLGTHLFNAMAPLDHREPGIAGALLTDNRARVSLIADGVHVHPAMIALAWRLKGPGAVVLVTDAMAGLGLGAGRYALGGREVTVAAGAARLRDGTLAGSVLSQDQAVRNLMTFTGCSLPEAWDAASATPAQLLGLGEHYGQLAPGARADLVLLTPKIEVAATWVAGQLAFRADTLQVDLEPLEELSFRGAQRRRISPCRSQQQAGNQSR